VITLHSKVVAHGNDTKTGLTCGSCC